MAQTVPWTVVTVNTVKCVLWRQGLALMDAKKGGPGNIVIHVLVIIHASLFLKKNECKVNSKLI